MVAKPWLLEYGEPSWLDHEVLRSVVGSGVHGIAIPGTDDHDEYGVYVETPDNVFAVSDYYVSPRTLEVKKRRMDYTARTQHEGARSGHGDIDLVVYSLRKYLRLSIKGNPTALLPLFAPASDIIVTSDIGEELRANRSWFMSAYAVDRFMGYMQAQHQRMLGLGKRNRVPNRPELIEKYGWDVKYGSHALRLAYEGYEIAKTGHLTLPMVRVQRERVLSVKRGEVPREEVSAEISEYEEKVRQLVVRGRLGVPPLPNFDAIEEWSIDTHLTYWKNHVR